MQISIQSELPLDAGSEKPYKSIEQANGKWYKRKKQISYKFLGSKSPQGEKKRKANGQ